MSLELEQWKPGCSCSQGVPSFCKGAGVGLNDGRRMGGGRDGWWLTCRQRRSLLCVSEAYKAASVCDGTEGQGTVAQSQRGCLPVSSQNYFLSAWFSVHLRPTAGAASPLFLHKSELAVHSESSSPQCGDATSFSSHYVLIRGRHGGGGGRGREAETGMRHRIAHVGSTGRFPETKGVRVQRVSDA